MFTGLLRLLGHSDDELAAVLAHEVGHVLARHTVRQLEAAGEAAGEREAGERGGGERRGREGREEGERRKGETREIGRGEQRAEEGKGRRGRGKFSGGPTTGYRRYRVYDLPCPHAPTRTAQCAQRHPPPLMTPTVTCNAPTQCHAHTHTHTHTHTHMQAHELFV